MKSHFHQVSLRTMIFAALVALLLLTLGGASVTVWVTHRIGSELTTMINSSITALNIAGELENSLVMQKGQLTYFFLDGDPQWLVQLREHSQAFEGWLRKAREFSSSERQMEILNEIESRYIRYSYGRDQVVEHYEAGEREAGLKLHREIRSQFLAIRDLSGQFKRLHEKRIAEVQAEVRSQLRSMDVMVLVAVPAAVMLSLLLGYILLNRVLDPIRRLAAGDAGSMAMGEPDEVKALSRRVRNLMEDVDQTQTQLQLSREHLLQSEKLAMVGKLAAGVAHTIRNPLTSVKMRLFSMQRSLDLSATQKEDFDVISEEIRHIDAIVRNFLEFSRPPKLKIQKISLSDVVDMAIQLLKHRIESYGVEVELYRQQRLPEVDGDPEQLKEVLVNLMINACEAMANGGRIVIHEEQGVTRPGGRVAVVRVGDNGPGIPEDILDKVFQPFFSMKEEGTGLGLSIAKRIIEDHKGCLNLKSREGKGTTFTITLPCKEGGAWLRY